MLGLKGCDCLLLDLYLNSLYSGFVLVLEAGNSCVVSNKVSKDLTVFKCLRCGERR
jgi:hypothetical protein